VKYLVTNQPELFDSELYERISVEKALELLESFEVCQLDTETRGLDVHSGELWLTQFGNRRLDIQIAVDCATISIKCFKSFLERKDVLFIIHNAKFDLRWFFKEHIVITNVYDTFLAEKILYLGYPPGIISLSLQACCKRYLGVEMDKSVRGEIYKGLTERVVIYGCTDVMYLEDIRDKQLEEIIKRGQLRALKIENQFVVVLAYIEYCGIKLDPDK
jgi:ribonuclease D